MVPNTSGTPYTGTPLVNVNAMPKLIAAVPSVIMNGETLKTATPTPLTTPTSVPAPMPARMPRVSVIAVASGWAAARGAMAKRRDNRGYSDDLADRKIKAAGEQRQHLSHRDDRQIGGLPSDRDQIFGGQEPVRRKHRNTVRAMTSRNGRTPIRTNSRCSALP